MVQEHTKSFNSNITLTVIEKFQPSSRADHISIFFLGGGVVGEMGVEKLFALLEVLRTLKKCNEN